MNGTALAVGAIKAKNNRIKCGVFAADCVKFMDGMEDNSVRLTITSPPYDDLRNYNGYQFDFKSIAESLYQITAPCGIVVCADNSE